MTIQLYGHPFSSYTWKPLIALYERDVPFRFRMIDPGHPDNTARIAELSPGGQFPALVDGEREIVGSNAVIDYLDRHYGDAAPMTPADGAAAVEARMMADLFDDYIMQPMQRIVGDALRPEGDRDAAAVSRDKAQLDRSYAWFDTKLAGRDWADGADFSLADCAAAPALFYADWVQPIGESHATLRTYRSRLLARLSIIRVVDEARPYRRFFPLGDPHRD